MLYLESIGMDHDICELDFKGRILQRILQRNYLRNEFYFWKVHGIMNTLGLLQSKWSREGFTLTFQETRSIHDSMNLPKIEFIAYIYILYYMNQSSINFQFSPNLAGFPDILN